MTSRHAFDEPARRHGGGPASPVEAMELLIDKLGKTKSNKTSTASGRMSCSRLAPEAPQ
ncbi:MAG: hypothetical protein AB7L71_12850 [Vicinamibacterales bacterium]